MHRGYADIISHLYKFTMHYLNKWFLLSFYLLCLVRFWIDPWSMIRLVSSSVCRWAVSREQSRNQLILFVVVCCYLLNRFCIIASAMRWTTYECTQLLYSSRSVEAGHGYFRISSFAPPVNRGDDFHGRNSTFNTTIISHTNSLFITNTDTLTVHYKKKKLRLSD